MSEHKNTIKGFNQGYDLKRLHPELSEKIFKGFSRLKVKNDYQKAFLLGHGQAEKDFSKTKFPTRHFSLNKQDVDRIHKTKDRNKDIKLDKGG